MPTNATAAIATREKRFMASPFPVLLLRMMRSVISFGGLGDRWRCLHHSARLVHVPALRNELLEDGRHRRYFVLTFRRLHLCDQISKFLIGSSHLRHHGRLLGHLLFVVGHVSLVPHHGSRTRSTLAEVVLVSGGRWRLSKDRGGAEDRYHQRDRWPHASDGRECFGSHGSPPRVSTDDRAQRVPRVVLQAAGDLRHHRRYAECAAGCSAGDANLFTGTSTILPVTPPPASNSWARLASTKGSLVTRGWILCCRRSSNSVSRSSRNSAGLSRFSHWMLYGITRLRPGRTQPPAMYRPKTAIGRMR